MANFKPQAQARKLTKTDFKYPKLVLPRIKLSKSSALLCWKDPRIRIGQHRGIHCPNSCVSYHRPPSLRKRSLETVGRTNELILSPRHSGARGLFTVVVLTPELWSQLTRPHNTRVYDNRSMLNFVTGIRWTNVSLYCSSNPRILSFLIRLLFTHSDNIKKSVSIPGITETISCLRRHFVQGNICSFFYASYPSMSPLTRLLESGKLCHQITQPYLLTQQTSSFWQDSKWITLVKERRIVVDD